VVLKYGTKGEIVARKCHVRCALFVGKVPPMEETPMKTLVTMIVALGLAVGFVAPTFAADKMPTTKADCEKAKMKWDEATKKCTKGSM
jgi:hypothetical protein